LCFFFKNDTAPVNINLGESTINSKGEINVLGVVFDLKLQWANHISNVIMKVNCALNAIKPIKK
jgi:hypothetical protein